MTQARAETESYYKGWKLWGVSKPGVDRLIAAEFEGTADDFIQRTGGRYAAVLKALNLAVKEGRARTWKDGDGVQRWGPPQAAPADVVGAVVDHYGLAEPSGGSFALFVVAVVGITATFLLAELGLVFHIPPATVGLIVAAGVFSSMAGVIVVMVLFQFAPPLRRRRAAEREKIRKEIIREATSSAGNSGRNR